jgi:hypothetical protein
VKDTIDAMNAVGEAMREDIAKSRLHLRAVGHLPIDRESAERELTEGERVARNSRPRTRRWKALEKLDRGRAASLRIPRARLDIPQLRQQASKRSSTPKRRNVRAHGCVMGATPSPVVTGTTRQCKKRVGSTFRSGRLLCGDCGTNRGERR